MLVLSVLAHASVWGDRDRPNDTIPRGEQGEVSPTRPLEP